MQCPAEDMTNTFKESMRQRPVACNIFTGFLTLDPIPVPITTDQHA